MVPDADHGVCELCGREVRALTKHHLIPRTRHRNKRNKKTFTREEVRGRIARLCFPCHKQVHSLIPEKELEARFNTVASLGRHPELARFVAWVRKRPDGTSVRSHASRNRPESGKKPRNPE